MKKILLLFVATIGLTLAGSAQKVTGIVKGVLQDSTSSSPLADATVSIVRKADSSLISFTLTESNGAFQVKNLDAGEYNVVASFSGLQTLKKSFTISSGAPVADLGIIGMSRIYKTMDEVVIQEAPVLIKGDTLSFRADAFKTKPNATVEDLLKKMPGVSVEKDGTVKAQGENVQKVYVDGKEFFSNDPKLATKNLTAEMVDRVEVFDDMSEQAKFNGIDDGSRSKSINLKLKKDKKKGLFGKAYAGGGTEDRYDAGITTNFFKGATQTSVIAKSNNINNVGFTLSDMMGMFGGGGGRGFSGGGGGGMTMVGGSGGGAIGGMMGALGSSGLSGFNLGNSGSGLTTSSQAGLNYRDTWSKTFDINGSYFFNHTGTNNNRLSYRQTLASDSSIHANDNTITDNWNNNHRFNFNLITTIDSFNSVIYSPNLNFQKSQSFSDDSLMSSVVKSANSYKINESRTINNNTGDGYNWSNNLIWRKKFRTPGRTLSVNLSNTLSENSREGLSTIHSKFYNNSGFKWNERKSDYSTDTKSGTNNYGVNLSYTEPLSRNKVLEVNYGHNENNSTSDRRTDNYNPVTGHYDLAVDSLTNNFENANITDRIGTNFRVVQKKYNFQLGVSLQQTTLQSDNLSKKTSLSQKYTNLFPMASFNYQFARSRALRINYRGRTNQPSISQLQDVPDINNYPYISKGNPNLKQEFTNNVMLSYNFFDIVSFRNLFAFLTFSNTYNKISSSVDQLPGGVQVTTPVNIGGVYNVSGNFNIGFPIKGLKGGNFNTTSRIGYNQDANLINKVKNYTRNLSVGEDLRLNYNYKEKLDLGITASINYNSVQYTVQSRNNQSYYTHNYSADATYTFPHGFILASDFDYIFNTGRADGYNQNYAMWNGSLAKQVFKNKRGEIKASVFDILNQNKSVNRNIGSNYIEDVQNSVLKRFFMLTFTYNINRMGGKTMPGMFDRMSKGVRFN